MTNDRKQRLEAEARTRRTVLENLKNELEGATTRYRRTRNEATDGARVTELAKRVRLAEIALDGVHDEIRDLGKPRAVSITSPREELLRQRAEIVQKREFRHRQHETAVQQERQRCGYNSERQIAQHLANTFGPGDRVRRQLDDLDERRLADISAELGEHDRRERRTLSGAA